MRYIENWKKRISEKKKQGKETPKKIFKRANKYAGHERAAHQVADDASSHFLGRLIYGPAIRGLRRDANSFRKKREDQKGRLHREE